VNCVRPSSTNQASAWQNLSQQVVGAFALAVLGTLVTSQSAQLIADRGALLDPDSQLAHTAAPALAQAPSVSAQTFAMIYQAASRLQADVLAGSLRDMFLVLAFSTLLGALLSVLFPMHQQPVQESDMTTEPAGEAATQTAQARQTTRAHTPKPGRHRLTI
jgi:hypothetical protein